MDRVDQSYCVNLNVKDRLKIIIAFVYVRLCCCKKIKKTDDIIN